MQGPGESLRQVREAHGRTIEEMSEATGIRLPFLTALEQDAFDSLPGRGFGKLYIRAYAEVLGFDPQPAIESYDRAVREMSEADTTSEAEGSPRPANGVLARWRSELIARRAESESLEDGDPGDLTFDGIEALEEPEPGGSNGSVRETRVPIEEAPAPARAAEVVSPSRPAPSRWWPGASLLLLVLLPLAAYLVFWSKTPEPSRVAAGDETPPNKITAPPPSPPQPHEAVADPQAATVPQATAASHEAARTPSPVRGQATPSSLEVAESGVGLRLVGTRLEGEGDRFKPGQRVTFATRVLGGAPGGHISHVWLRDGKVEQSIRLRLGGASWRTWSTKTLGRPGAWTVEARDEQGRLLARADLTVAP